MKYNLEVTGVAYDPMKFTPLSEVSGQVIDKVSMPVRYMFKQRYAQDIATPEYTHEMFVQDVYMVHNSDGLHFVPVNFVKSTNYTDGLPF